MNARIGFERQAGIVRLTLQHAGKFNAMSRAMWRDLRTQFEAVQTDDSVRCVVVAGAQGHFCAGGDIAEYPDFRFDAEQLRHFHEEEVWGGLGAMLQCDVPIVAQIEGHCVGAGLEIAACCDMRLASATARFGAPIARLGFPMAPREAALLAGQLSATTVRTMLLEATFVDAPTLAQQGFLTRVLPESELVAEVDACARRVSQLAPQAARMNKRTLRALQTGVTPDALATDGAAYAWADSAEHQEGIMAFLAKRPPVFS